MVGGVAAAAHHAGKRSAENQAAEQAQDAQLADLQAQQQYAQPQYAPPPPAPAAGGTDMVAELTSLKGLLDSGVLTQAEFDAQKQKVLNAR
ncbi:SHOCT domain-containing protein [Aquihabitans sp. McL0605]|uniref:SHOCT domain-containing protein n=1 Tax=Aquihabitans sp. McL0605 TaxID=3415671 RepID=UPI003CE88D86